MIAYGSRAATHVPDQRNELISLEICEGGQVLLHFHLRGRRPDATRTTTNCGPCSSDFDDDDLMTNERVYLERPSAEVIAGGLLGA